jgi:iron complex outermembrane receptor protein
LLHCTTLDVIGKECERRGVFRIISLLMLLSFSAPALAQRTTNNAVTASDDAFGRAVGSEKIGIYSTEEVRGFNPVEAGNVRIEGLYFDQQSQPSGRLVDSSSIRVGYAARGYPFPAPTGIADLRLEKSEGQRVFSFDIEHEDRANFSGSFQAKIPLAGDRLGLSAGVGFRIANLPQGRNGRFNSEALVLNWKPYDGAELVGFLSRFNFVNGRVQPIIFPGGSFVPPRIDRDVNQGQDWARAKSTGLTHGATVKLPLGAFKLEAGLFRSSREDPVSFAELLRGTSDDGRVANRELIADEDNLASSTSGEMRLSHVWQTGKLRQALMTTVKGRTQNRIYGGQQRVSLGASQIFMPDNRVRPSLTFGANDASSVRQFTFGLGYDLQWQGRGSLGLVIQKSNYRKETRFANPVLPLLESRDKPLLFSANGAVILAPGLTAYAGYVRGLEESAVAPDIATNRNEAPPAIRTSQADAGLRYAISPKLSVIAGVFSVRKPYYNLEATTLRFQQLGVVDNRGVEISLAGSLAPGLTVVAGTVLLDPKISGAEVHAGRLGSRPVGSFRRHSIANFDWKPMGQTAWSLDLALDSFSSETGNARNSFVAPPRQTVGLGTRYRFKIGQAKLLLRGQVTNLFNNYGWKVSSSGGFTATLPRTFVLNLAGDF